MKRRGPGRPRAAAVPRTCLCLTADGLGDLDATARAVYEHSRNRLSTYQRVKVVEFTSELPKAISSKIRRVELRQREAERGQTSDETGQYRERNYH